MTQHVQKFIERNIQLIENNEWEHVFLRWYNTAGEIWPDDDEFKEFISVLLESGVDPVLDSIYSVLYDEIEYMMTQERMSGLGGTHYVSVFGIINKLDSRLGYSELDIKKIMDDVANKYGMKYTDFYGGGYVW